MMFRGIDQLNAVKGVMVSDLNLAVGSPGRESSARVTIAADNKEQAETALSRLRRIADSKKLLLISSIEAV